MSSMPAAGLIHLGMDTSMNAIVVGVLRPGEEMPVVERVFNDGELIRRFVGRCADRRLLSACDEAGPGSYELYRLLSAMGDGGRGFRNDDSRLRSTRGRTLTE